MILLKLFLAFAKVGVMTFGGGYAMLPILQREIVERRGWAVEEAGSHPAGAGGSEHLLLDAALLPSPLHGHQCELPGDPNPQFAGTQGPCEPLRLSPSTACLPLPGAPTGTLTVLPQGSLDQGHSLLICSRASPFCPHRAAPADLIPPALGQSRPC